tara:strand:+ start:452 stop:1027 length:576 start_codon:yes stop_codon:yes gene_type:complete
MFVKILISVLVIIFSLQSLSNADNIEEFELEGMSIGDSLLDFMSKSSIDSDKEALYPNKKFLTVFYEFKSDQYDDIQIDILSNDPKYLIHGVEAKKYFPDNIKGCLSRQKEVSKSVIELTGQKFQEASRPHRGDETGKSIVYFNSWYFDDGSTLQVYCTDWSVEKGHHDELKVSTASKDLFDFILNDAYKK